MTERPDLCLLQTVDPGLQTSSAFADEAPGATLAEVLHVAISLGGILLSHLPVEATEIRSNLAVAFNSGLVERTLLVFVGCAYVLADVRSSCSCTADARSLFASPLARCLVLHRSHTSQNLATEPYLKHRKPQVPGPLQASVQHDESLWPEHLQQQIQIARPEKDGARLSLLCLLQAAYQTCRDKANQASGLRMKPRRNTM